MEPTFTHNCHHDRELKGGCPRCLQQEAVSMTVFVDEAEQVNSQYSQTIQEYGREMVLENLEIQERELKSELMRTYLLNAAGPHIVRSILSHNDSPVGQRIYQEIREEAKRYE